MMKDGGLGSTRREILKQRCTNTHYSDGRMARGHVCRVESVFSPTN